MLKEAKTFLTFFSLQFISYFNITVDMRAVNHDQYTVAALTNVVAPIIAWVMVKKIGEQKKSLLGITAVALGGVTSTWAGMWLTRVW